MLYVIADTHLSFSVEKPMDVFGAKWENHAEKLKENWIKTVKDEDTVVVPGDVSWGINLEEAKEDLLFIDKLPGKKIIGKGNHDYWWSTVRKIEAFFEENGIKTISLLYNNALFAENTVICGTRGWMNDFGIKEEDERIIKREAARMELSLKEGEKLKILHPDSELKVFMHYPAVFGKFINYEMIDMLYRYGVADVYYGHLHNVTEEQTDKEYLGIRFHLIAGDYLKFQPMRVESRRL